MWESEQYWKSENEQVELIMDGHSLRVRGVFLAHRVPTSAPVRPGEVLQSRALIGSLGAELGFFHPNAVPYPTESFEEGFRVSVGRSRQLSAR